MARDYANLVLLRVIFFTALFVGLALLSVLLAVSMLFIWHLGLAFTLLASLGPWVCLIAILGTLWIRTSRRLNRKKALLSSQPTWLLSVGSLLLSLLLKK